MYWLWIVHAFCDLLNDYTGFALRRSIASNLVPRVSHLAPGHSKMKDYGNDLKIALLQTLCNEILVSYSSFSQTMIRLV